MPFVIDKHLVIASSMVNSDVTTFLHVDDCVYTHTHTHRFIH